MQKYIQNFFDQVSKVIKNVSTEEIAKALNILLATYERDGRIYIFGNGGSLAIATHWVSDFNKTVFTHHLNKDTRRFQAIRLPSTESELTAWANDIGFDMIFAGPLKNYLQDSDTIIAISSSGNSPNIIKAAELAKNNQVPVIGLAGFDGGRLDKLADARITVFTEPGEYELVESAHEIILHLMTKYFKDYFDYLVKQKKL